MDHYHSDLTPSDGQPPDVPRGGIEIDPLDRQQAVEAVIMASVLVQRQGDRQPGTAWGARMLSIADELADIVEEFGVRATAGAGA